MKRNLNLTLIGVFALTLFLTTVGCKFDGSDDTTTVRIDISDLKKHLVTPALPAEQSTLNGPSLAVTSPSSAAQTPVVTLIIAPLTFTNHGKPYSPDEPFTDTVKDDLENDAPNSANFIHFEQLPSDNDYIEVEVPNISEGWQLLAAASTTTFTSIDDMTDNDNNDALAYVGFTERAFTSVDDFNTNSGLLEMRRACYQDTPPKGCATFNENKDAIATDAVEILSIEINGTEEVHGSFPYPWVVRSGAIGTVDNVEISAATALDRMNSVVSTLGKAGITSLKVKTSHQESLGQSAACIALTAASTVSDFETECGIQEYPFTY